MIDNGIGFQVGYDPRMTHNRRNFRVMIEQCRHPKRSGSTNLVGPVMEERYSTRINEGGKSVMVRGHDDWASVQDAAAAGLFTVDADGVEPGAYLKFSALGEKVVEALSKHKRDGASFATFKWEPETESVM